jgi:hypothetical protein
MTTQPECIMCEDAGAPEGHICARCAHPRDDFNGGTPASSLVLSDNPHFTGAVIVAKRWNPRDCDPQYAKSEHGVTMGCTDERWQADYGWCPVEGWCLWQN